MVDVPPVNKTLLAATLGIARSSLYYTAKQTAKDWQLKTKIEEVLREHPSYGSRRLAIELQRNRKATKRVMRLFGIKPYRRSGKRWRRKKTTAVRYPNLLFTTIPLYPHHLWAADFTELSWHDRTIYVATVIDLFTRQIVGVAVAVRKGTVLTMQALCASLLHHPHPTVFHSDNGREYEARAFTDVLSNLNIQISRSNPGCPWENGYQESFYDKFKIELGDPNRFKSLGELVAAIYYTVWAYNHTRIHSVLKVPPTIFAQQFALAGLQHLN